MYRGWPQCSTAAIVEKQDHVNLHYSYNRKPHGCLCGCDPHLGIPVHGDCIKKGCVRLSNYFRPQGLWGENFTFTYLLGVGVLQGTCIEVRGQFVGGRSLLPSSWFQGPNSGSGLALLPTKASHLPPSHHFYLQAFNSSISAKI